MEVKIGVQHAPRELSISTELTSDEVLTALTKAVADEGVFTLNDDKGRTAAVPAERVTYLDFTSDNGRAVGFGLAAAAATTASSE